MRVLVISPHLDDGVFACGDLLQTNPGSAVVTVTAKQPDSPPPHHPNNWDHDACGFAVGADVVGERREEDRLALAVLGATPQWLDFLDSQYSRDRLPIPGVVEALSQVVESSEWDCVAAPLGASWHGDHQDTAEAARHLARRFARLEWLIYEETIYRRARELPWAPTYDEQNALERWQRVGRVQAVASSTASASPKKVEAVACYKSQLRGLDRAVGQSFNVKSEVLGPERHWRLFPGG